MTDPFVNYLTTLVSYGHDRNWVRRNEPGLRVRFESDPEPFLPLPDPDPPGRDRYEEI